MGLTKYFNLFKIKLFCENNISIFVIKRTHLESFYCWEKMLNVKLADCIRLTWRYVYLKLNWINSWLTWEHVYIWSEVGQGNQNRTDLGPYIFQVGQLYQNQSQTRLQGLINICHDLRMHDNLENIFLKISVWLGI